MHSVIRSQGSLQKVGTIYNQGQVVKPTFSQLFVKSIEIGKQIVLKMHFKPLQVILEHVFSPFAWRREYLKLYLQKKLSL